MHAEDIAVTITLFLESLIVVTESNAAVSDCNTVTCNCSDNLKLSSLLIRLSVTKAYYTDIDEAASDVCESVCFRSTFNVVKLDSENALKLSEKECIGTSSWHTSVDLSWVSLCISYKFFECVEWSIDRASEN